jgi:hypothetical protein
MWHFSFTLKKKRQETIGTCGRKTDLLDLMKDKSTCSYIGVPLTFLAGSPEGVMTFWAPDLRAIMFLVLPEEEFKNRHRGDLSRSRFINPKQSGNTLPRGDSRQAQEGGLP